MLLQSGIEVSGVFELWKRYDTMRGDLQVATERADTYMYYSNTAVGKIRRLKLQCQKTEAKAIRVARQLLRRDREYMVLVEALHTAERESGDGAVGGAGRGRASAAVRAVESLIARLSRMESMLGPESALRSIVESSAAGAGLAGGTVGQQMGLGLRVGQVAGPRSGPGPNPGAGHPMPRAGTSTTGVADTSEDMDMAGAGAGAGDMLNVEGPASSSSSSLVVTSGAPIETVFTADTDVHMVATDPKPIAGGTGSALSSGSASGRNAGPTALIGSPAPPPLLSRGPSTSALA